MLLVQLYKEITGRTLYLLVLFLWTGRYLSLFFFHGCAKFLTEPSFIHSLSFQGRLAVSADAPYYPTHKWERSQKGISQKCILATAKKKVTKKSSCFSFFLPLFFFFLSQLIETTQSSVKNKILNAFHLFVFSLPTPGPSFLTRHWYTLLPRTPITPHLQSLFQFCLLRAT